MRLTLVAVLVLLSFLCGCPDRKEAIDQVGGAPKAMVDQARARADKAEAKLQQNASEATKAAE